TRKGLAQPIGSLTQMGTIRLGKRTDNRTPLVREFVPLSSIDDLVFGAWDIFPDNCYQSALKAGVVDPAQLEQVRTELEGVTPWPAAFDPEYVKRLNGPHVKKAANKLALAEQIMADIEGFRRSTGVKRAVMVWCGSTESFLRAEDVHQSLAAFEAGLRANHPAIAPSMLYAYAALQLGIPFANGAPNLTVDIPALVELAAARRVPICGKDFKTGQTLMKT